MMALPKLVRRFRRSRRGVAAIEFALVLPVLLLLFLGSFDAGNAIAVYMKVRSAAFTMGAIANQFNNGNDPIQATDMTALTGATAQVMSPYSSTAIVATISQIKATSATNAIVSWSYSLNGTAHTVGTSWNSLPSQLTTTNSCNSYPCYLIFSEVSYTYTPSFGYFLTGAISLSDNLYVTPRSSVCVAYVPQTGSTC
jgi:Flp pilus assembly protein TadG